MTPCVVLCTREESTSVRITVGHLLVADKLHSIMLTIFPTLLICASVVAASQHTAKMKLKFIPVVPITTPKPANKLPIVLEVHKNDGFAHAPGKHSVSNLRYTALTQEDLRRFQPSVWFKSLVIAKVV